MKQKKIYDCIICCEPNPKAKSKYDWCSNCLKLSHYEKTSLALLRTIVYSLEDLNINCECNCNGCI